MSPHKLLIRIECFAGRTPPGFYIRGWSDPELAHTWATGFETIFELQCPRTTNDRQIEFHVAPWVASPRPTTQRMAILVNGHRLGFEDFHGPTCLGYRLPNAIFGDVEWFTVTLHCPDATVPASVIDSSETRQLSFMFKEVRMREIEPFAPFQPRMRPPPFRGRYSATTADRATIQGLTGLPMADLAICFESLGINCVFGLFQRRCGAEPLGLLRFAGLPYPSLVDGIASAFEGLDDTAGLSCRTDGPETEWTLYCERYGMEIHTHKPSRGVTAQQIINEQGRLLAFRRAKLAEILSTGEKLFVVTRPQGMTPAQALPLLAVLRSLGPNALVFASDTTGFPAGTVHELAPHLFCGSLDGIDAGRDERDVLPNDTWLGDAAFTAWLSISANAYRLWREAGGGRSNLAT